VKAAQTFQMAHVTSKYMLIIHAILGIMAFAAIIGIVLSVLLSSDNREQILRFFDSVKSSIIIFVRKLAKHI